MANLSLIEVRQRAHKTKTQVAKAAGVSVRMYQDYESSVSEPRVSVAIRIARFLDSSVETLWGQNSNAL